MRFIRVTLLFIATGCLLPACSGTTSSTSTPAAVPLFAGERIADGSRRAVVGMHATSPGWLSEQAAATRKLYVSDDGADALYIYDAGNLTKIGEITSGIAVPVGNFVDPKGNLYVTNLGGNSVTVYARGSTVPFKTYTSGLAQPTSIAVGTDGTLYVSEYPTNTIVEYDPGKTTPARTLSVKSVQGVALDSSNNLYASYTAESGSGGVEEFKPKATVGHDLGIAVGSAGDVKLDKNNDLLVGDQNSDTVNFYKPGETMPYGAISTPQTPFKFALGSYEKQLYVATGVPELDIFAAMPNGKRVGVLTNGLQSTSGVSLDPAPPL